jgi:predicted transcriptional regulator
MKSVESKNPFMDGVVIRTVGKVKTVEANNSSNITFTATIPNRMETQMYIKVYKGMELEIIRGLSKTAYAILNIITHRIRWNEDLYKLEGLKLKEELGVSRATITTSIRELVDYKFIARYKNAHYWINPNKFFYGNRLETYSECADYNQHGVNFDIEE